MKGRTLIVVVVVVSVVVFLTVGGGRRDGRAAFVVVVVVFVVVFLIVYVIVGYDGLVTALSLSSILMQQPRIGRRMAKIRRIFKIIDIFFEIWYYWTLFISTIFAWFDYLKPWFFALDISYCWCLPQFVPYRKYRRVNYVICINWILQKTDLSYPSYRDRHILLWFKVLCRTFCLYLPLTLIPIRHFCKVRIWWSCNGTVIVQSPPARMEMSNASRNSIKLLFYKGTLFVHFFCPGWQNDSN